MKEISEAVVQSRVLWELNEVVMLPLVTAR